MASVTVSYEYVKRIDVDTWEVKLGAGILPKIIHQSDVAFYNAMSGSTMGVPDNETLESFRTKLNCIAAINQYLHSLQVEG